VPSFVVPVSLVFALLAAQAPAPGTQPFRSSIDVVRVDVSAIDGSGRPIADLTASDFELRVDGRPRTIVSAQFVAVPSAGCRSARSFRGRTQPGGAFCSDAKAWC
jgi:hypothetical protein